MKLCKFLSKKNVWDNELTVEAEHGGKKSAFIHIDQYVRVTDKEQHLSLPYCGNGGNCPVKD